MLIENGVASEVGALCEALERHDRQLGYVALQSKLLLEDAARLYEENAKLRELAETLWILMSVGPCNRSQLEWLDDRCDEIGRERPSDMVRELGIKGWPR